MLLTNERKLAELMEATGMEELQAYRHLEQRKHAQRLYEKSRHSQTDRRAAR